MRSLDGVVMLSDIWLSYSVYEARFRMQRVDILYAFITNMIVGRVTYI
jgi:hypothetical protein